MCCYRIEVQLAQSDREEESLAQLEETSERNWGVEIKQARPWNWKTLVKNRTKEPSNQHKWHNQHNRHNWRAFILYITAARFKEPFLRKAEFASRPETYLDIPKEQRTNFVPGRDQIFEDIIQEEKVEEEDLAGEDLLSFVEADHTSDISKAEAESES